MSGRVYLFGINGRSLAGDAFAKQLRRVADNVTSITAPFYLDSQIGIFYRAVLSGDKIHDETVIHSLQRILCPYGADLRVYAI